MAGKSRRGNFISIHFFQYPLVGIDNRSMGQKMSYTVVRSANIASTEIGDGCSYPLGKTFDWRP